MAVSITQRIDNAWRWVTRAEHRAKARAMRDDVVTAFTAHPKATGETYLEHLWFTLTMAARFLYIALVVVIHGLFPFLLPRTGSKQIEHVYRIIKARIPKARRDAIDIDYSV
ncbi:MAG: hypothetical protein K2X09_06145 [Rickettsiales bacterium]|nr:hypothetical protein [Rickettsiales bacterium]